MFRFFGRRPAQPRAGRPAPAARSPAATRASDPDAAHVETIDEWFVRTARLLLRRPSPGAGRDGKPKSSHEQRIDALEKANAALKADNERLSSEVVALRTMLYAHDRKD